MIIEQDRRRVEKVVRTLISEKSGMDESDIQNDSSFSDDLKIDSLDHVEIILDLEKQFKIRIPDEEIEHLDNFESLVDFIVDKQRVLV
jgi:acyl carrier protein